VEVTCTICPDRLWHQHCRLCGHKVTSGVKRCPSCGVPWEAPKAPTQAEPAPQRPPWCQPCQTFHATDAETRARLHCYAGDAGDRS